MKVSFEDAAPTLGSDALHDARDTHRQTGDDDTFAFEHNNAYGEYFRMHKVLVGRGGSEKLIDIADRLSSSAHPDHLRACGWSYLEASLCNTEPGIEERIALTNQAEDVWVKALDTQYAYPHFSPERDLTEFTDDYRTALDIAYLPLARSVIAGDVTPAVREKVFADTLAIAETCVLEQYQSRHAIYGSNREHAIGDYTGFLHECNCLLALLYRNDPQRIPLPSTMRAGSGLEYADETHDIMIVHQKWGKIHRTTPVEVKAHTGSSEYSRYKALIIRGKAHLLPQDFGYHRPEILINAFSDVYNSTVPSPRSLRIVEDAAQVVEKLLVKYQKTEREDLVRRNTVTDFHNSAQLGRYASRTDILSMV